MQTDVLLVDLPRLL